MAIRKTCPAAVNGLLSRGSRTQPVPSIAACLVGSARTAKMTSAGAWMIVVALRLSSAMCCLLMSESVTKSDAFQARNSSLLEGTCPLGALYPLPNLQRYRKLTLLPQAEVTVERVLGQHVEEIAVGSPQNCHI